MKQPAMILTLAAVAACLSACSEDSSGNTSTDNSQQVAPSLTVSGTPGGAAAVGQSYSFQPSVAGSASGATFSIAGKPAWLAFSATTGLLSGTPSAADVGITPDMSITVSAGGQQSTIGPFRITVSGSSPVVTTPPVNPPPVVTTPPTNPPLVVTPPPAGSPIPAVPAQGFSTVRIVSTGDRPELKDGVGAFRIVCGYSHMAFDDPIVFPNQAGRSHLHVFFGNDSTNAASTTSSLLGGGSSSCAGGIVNRSSYWIPAMVDASSSRAIVPHQTIVYYKSGYNKMPPSSVQAPPNGLRMVAGNSVSQSGPIDPSWAAMHTFYCDLPDGGGHVSKGQQIPACPVGSTLVSTMEFPNCWDGVNLDSVDHRGHMTYSWKHDHVCPASHPVPIPVITQNVEYKVTAGMDTTRWRLASDAYDSSIPGGYTMHGDVWIAWDEAVKAAWMSNCVQAGLDCNAYNIGDGRQLF